MYKLTTYTELELGHRLASAYTGKCRHLHGHRYQVEIQLGSEDLNKDQMVIDFKRLKEIVKEQLDDQWDHGFALCAGDPLVPAIQQDKEVARFHILPVNPTLEYMAKVWYRAVKGALQNLKCSHPESIAPSARLISIKASETARNTCEYSEDGCKCHCPGGDHGPAASKSEGAKFVPDEEPCTCAADAAAIYLGQDEYSRLLSDGEEPDLDDSVYLVSYWTIGEDMPLTEIVASSLKGRALLESIRGVLDSKLRKPFTVIGISRV